MRAKRGLYAGYKGYKILACINAAIRCKKESRDMAKRYVEFRRLNGVVPWFKGIAIAETARTITVQVGKQVIVVLKSDTRRIQGN